MKNDGTVVAWGEGDHGQTIIPAGLSGVTAIAAGVAHTVALKNSGTVVAWGSNDSDQTTIPLGLSGVTAVMAGYYHTVALKSNGTVVPWGYNDPDQTTIPAGLSGVTAIAAGGYHTVALKNNGTVVAWGANWDDQTTIPLGLSGVTAIAAGGAHTVALKNNGTVVAWGGNNYGQTTIPAGLSGVTAIAAGGSYTVALKNDGTVVAWGENDYGQTAIPAGLSGVTAIAAGGAHTVALINPGSIIPPPTVTLKTGNLAANAVTLTISGTNFSPIAADNTVVFTPAGSGNVTASTATTLTVTSLSGLTPGALHAVVTTSGRSSGAAVQVATVTLTYTGWASRYLPLATSNNRLPGADADGDGHSNLMEYATGTNPAGWSDGPEVFISNDRLAMRYTVSLLADPPVRVTPQLSPNATNWLEGAAYLNDTILQKNDSQEVHLVETVERVGAGGKKFLRLKVSAP
jgi:hypothetical protein